MQPFVRTPDGSPRCREPTSTPIRSFPSSSSSGSSAPASGRRCSTTGAIAPTARLNPEFELNRPERRGRDRPAHRRQLRLRLVARARAVGAGGLRLPRHHGALVRRHLLRQLLPERTAAGGPAGRRGRRLFRPPRAVARATQLTVDLERQLGARRRRVSRARFDDRALPPGDAARGLDEIGRTLLESARSPPSSGARVSEAVHDRGAAGRRHRARGDRRGGAGAARGGRPLRLSASRRREYAGRCGRRGRKRATRCRPRTRDAVIECRRGAARRGGRSRARRGRGEAPARGGPARAPKAARRLRQSAAGRGPPGAAPRLAAPARAPRGRGPADRAGAHRRALLRRAARPRRATPRSTPCATPWRRSSAWRGSRSRRPRARRERW